MKVMPIIVPFKYGGNYDGTELIANVMVPYFSRKKMDYKLITILERLAEQNGYQNNKLKNLDLVVDTTLKLRFATYEIIQNGQFPLLIGGDHSLSLGSVAGVLEHYEDVGIIWIDAHGDMNTDKTSLTGNIHGMSLALLQRIGNEQLSSVLPFDKKINSENILIIGVRDLEPLEKKLIEKHNINYLTYEDVLNYKDKRLYDYLLKFYKNKIKKIHISFDLDSLNPLQYPGVSVPVPGGFILSEVIELLKFLFDNFSITSMDIVEFNRKHDLNGVTEKAMFKLIELVNTLVDC